MNKSTNAAPIKPVLVTTKDDCHDPQFHRDTTLKINSLYGMKRPK